MCMAEHFLDTETRQEIPTTALACVEAGLTVQEARRIWRYEVSPALAFNLIDIAGEWAGWNQEKVVEEIETRRSSGRHRPGIFGYLGYRINVHFAHAFWESIEKCLETVLGYPDYNQQRQVAQDLRLLAQYYFDFGPFENDIVDDERRQRARGLYPEPFLTIVQPTSGPETSLLGPRRIKQGLSQERSEP